MRLEGFSEYEIYPEMGQIWSYKSNRFIGSKGTNGYIQCGLLNDNKEVLWDRLHRIIWIAVNGEIPINMEINHIDENKENNSIFNLSLMSHKDNVNWGTGTIRSNEKRKNNQSQSKPIIAFKKGVISLYYPSIMEAERNGFSAGNICSCATGNRNTHKGYQWRYLDDILGDWLEEIQDEDMKSEKGYN